MLRVEELRAAYGRVLALHGVSLEVPDGGIVALLGANGAGKSTTLGAICGLVPIVGGRVEFEGRRIDRLAPHQVVRLGIALVPERRELFPDLTVAANLRLGAYSRRDRSSVQRDWAWVHELFPILTERAGQLARTLSGGEQQMLAIGRALMSRPRVLLLDEPSQGLAPILVEEIFRVIRRINEEGTTVLLVEQNTALALAVADYGYVLENGSVAVAGPSEELLRGDLVQRSYLGERVS